MQQHCSKSIMQSSWQPSTTWVFAVGVLEWTATSYEEMSYAKSSRADAKFVEVLRCRGVPDSQIVFMRDREVTLDATHDALDDLLSCTAVGDTLIVYLTGHGLWDPEIDEHYYVQHDAPHQNTDQYPMAHELISMGEVLRRIRFGFHGSCVLMFADCCFSGGLAEKAELINCHHDEVYGTGFPFSLAVLCSTSAHNTSTGNWTFTAGLIDGFTGHDIDYGTRIGPILDTSIDDVPQRYLDYTTLYKNIHSEMALFEAQHSEVWWNATFDSAMRLSQVSETMCHVSPTTLNSSPSFSETVTGAVPQRFSDRLSRFPISACHLVELCDISRSLAGGSDMQSTSAPMVSMSVKHAYASPASKFDCRVLLSTRSASPNQGLSFQKDNITHSSPSSRSTHSPHSVTKECVCECPPLLERGPRWRLGCVLDERQNEAGILECRVRYRGDENAFWLPSTSLRKRPQKTSQFDLGMRVWVANPDTELWPDSVICSSCVFVDTARVLAFEAHPVDLYRIEYDPKFYGCGKKWTPWTEWVSADRMRRADGLL